MLAGDLNAGKAILRDYINATITFERLLKNQASIACSSLMAIRGLSISLSDH